MNLVKNTDVISDNIEKNLRKIFRKEVSLGDIAKILVSSFCLSTLFALENYELTDEQKTHFLTDFFAACSRASIKMLENND